MSEPVLGRLEKVELRQIWVSEATSFTPWLARDENLVILADALGLELELEAQEKAVGPFRADILCKELGSNSWVLIENQLEKTDHGHLGQLLTYASGLEAVTIVWIAARFTEEHRSTLDWLNKITDDTFRFFGLEVELWRIGDSPAAPKFNIVSKPNDWSRSVAQAARAIDEAELSDTRVLQREYWEQFHLELDRHKGPISGNRKAQLQSWMTYPVGRSGFMLGAVMIRPKKQVRAELYISNEHAKSFFFQLCEQRAHVEQELGYELLWEELPDARDKRVSIALRGVDPEDRSDWPRQHAWLAKHVNDLRRVFESRVRQLRSENWQEPVEKAVS
ncbi:MULTISPECIES: DUF4268 domain-containing protein [Sphingomonas]|uniref:DUF4268 domain-containing protein n=1 Tax=Sphingomonas TaxID=13687 RepID=UPI000DF00C58|nr:MULTISPECIES: DUF4268 domain-containing protein [Sphingomonas]